jgi:cystathionine beta-synthase
MRMMGYENMPGPTARDLVQNKKVSDVVALEVTDTVDTAIRCMSENDFSQIPVTQDKRIVGSVSESNLYARMIEDPSIRTQPLRNVMQKAWRFVDIDTPVKLLAPMITAEHPAVVVRDFKAGKSYILTGYDVLRAI